MKLHKNGPKTSYLGCTEYFGREVITWSRLCSKVNQWLSLWLYQFKQSFTTSGKSRLHVIHSYQGR